ncbi:hypothetical protein [Streptomyces sp. SM10]|uniref:hypothetical protein n=1 Tax=Streptomyces sp. SM10 TaxID=565556 RepID=UPI0035BC3447
MAPVRGNVPAQRGQRELRTVEFYEEDTRVALPPAHYDTTVTQGDGSGIGYASR